MVQLIINRIVFWFFLAFALFSCKKTLEFELNGYINDSSLHQALQKAKVTVIQVNSDGSVENSPLYEGFTDENGDFKCRFKRDKALEYQINIEKSNYFELNEKVNFSDLSTKHPNLLIYEMYGKAWIEFKPINQFPASSNDVLTLIYDDKNPICSTCCTEEKFYFTGLNPTPKLCTFYGNKNYKFNYIVSSPFEQKNIDITTIAFDTLIYEINY